MYDYVLYYICETFMVFMYKLALCIVLIHGVDNRCTFTCNIDIMYGYNVHMYNMYDILM